MPQKEIDHNWMAQALDLAAQAESIGEVPVGAVVVDADNHCIGKGWNQPIDAQDPSAHAEIIALRAAAKQRSNYRLPGCTLYVTIEPCTMCVGAIIHSRIERLVFGASEPKAGAVISQLNLLDADIYNHRIIYEGGVMAALAGQLISDFFRKKRR